MKRLSTVFVLLLIISISVFSQNNQYTIEGRIGNYNSPVCAYFLYEDGVNLQVDTCVLHDGHFRFSGHRDYTFFARLVLDHGDNSNPAQTDLLSFYVDAGTTYISGRDSIVSASVKGSPTTDLYCQYQSQLLPLQEEGRRLQLRFQQADDLRKQNTQFMDSMNIWYQSIQARYNDMTLDFIRSHPGSMLGVYMLLSEVQTRPGNDAITPTYEALSPSVKESEPGLRLRQLIEENSPLAIGSTAPDFSIADNNGHLLRLSDYKGHYVLLHFWSPDCDHCLQAQQGLKQAYMNIKDRKFRIVSIAVESPENRQVWLANLQSGLDGWVNASELKGWQGEVTRQYKVYAVPYNYLIDQEGKIVGRELYNDDLLIKLKHLLN